MYVPGYHCNEDEATSQPRAPESYPEDDECAAEQALALRAPEHLATHQHSNAALSLQQQLQHFLEVSQRQQQQQQRRQQAVQEEDVGMQLPQGIPGLRQEELQGFERAWQAGLEVRRQVKEVLQLQEQLVDLQQTPESHLLIRPVLAQEYEELGTLHAKLERECMAALGCDVRGSWEREGAAAADAAANTIEAVVAMIFGGLLRLKDGRLLLLSSERIGTLCRRLVELMSRRRQLAVRSSANQAAASRAAAEAASRAAAEAASRAPAAAEAASRAAAASKPAAAAGLPAGGRCSQVIRARVLLRHAEALAEAAATATEAAAEEKLMSWLDQEEEEEEGEEQMGEEEGEGEGEGDGEEEEGELEEEEVEGETDEDEDEGDVFILWAAELGMLESSDGFCFPPSL